MPELQAAPLDSADDTHTFELPLREVHIRHLEHQDVARLEWHGGRDLRSFYNWQWEQQQQGALSVLVADFNQYPVGQVAVHWHGKPTHPGIPDLQSFRVFPAFRGMGVGTRLLQAGEGLVAERHFRQVSLSVGENNEHARRLYERIGYSVVGQPYVDVWEYVDARGNTVCVEERVLDMVKQLPAA